MNVLFEDDGQLKAGTVLADQDASLQVEAVSGKRMKIKAGNVIIVRYEGPAGGPGMQEMLHPTAFLKGSQGISGQVWPLFFTAIYYLIFSGVLTVALSWLEKKMDYFKG